MRYILFFSILFCLSTETLKAQDPQFAQFYANPIYLNPAFTGYTDQHRFVGNYRNQWLGLQKAFQTYNVSYDRNLYEKNSGIGIAAWQDVAGTTKLTTTNVGVSYSYNVHFNETSDLRFGLQANYGMKTFNMGNLVFNDQLIPGSTAVSADLKNLGKVNYLDLHFGSLYTGENYWFGATFRHINMPNTSINDKTAKTPVGISLHGGYRFMQLKTGERLTNYLSPVFNYRHQNNFDQLDLGVYYVSAPLHVGLWYRGLPLKKYSPEFANHDALSLMIGYELKETNLRIGYSYCYGLSKLTTAANGSHEISICYELSNRGKTNGKSSVPVPKL